MTGADVKQLRERLGLTQPQLARLVARDWNTVSRWERGCHPIPNSAALALRDLAEAADRQETRR